MPNAFRHSGIFPYDAEVLMRKITEHIGKSSEVPDDQVKLTAIRGTLRTNGVSEELVAQTLHDVLLEQRGLKRTDIFCDELSKLLKKKADTKQEGKGKDTRLTTQGLGQILLLSGFEDGETARDEANTAKRKTKRNTVPKKPVNPVTPAKRGRGRPKKVI